MWHLKNPLKILTCNILTTIKYNFIYAHHSFEYWKNLDWMLKFQDKINISKEARVLTW